MTGASALSAWAVGAASGVQSGPVAGAADPSLAGLLAAIVGPESALGIGRLIVLTLAVAVAGLLEDAADGLLVTLALVRSRPPAAG